MSPEVLAICSRGDAAITCGECGRSAELGEWTVSRLGLPMERGVYQCPHCRAAFRRQVVAEDETGRATIRCVAVAAVL